MIPVNSISLTYREKELLGECIDTGWISSEGPFVSKFEKQMAERSGRRFAVAVSSGTAALDIAVKALGINPGDEVIMPAFTIISCAAEIVRSGAIPVLIDADPDTWNMAVDTIESKITSRTKAIMAVHTYGLPVNMQSLMAVARRHKLMVIEDAAEAIGQTCNGLPCGSFGDISIVSFYANKHVTTGEGGMVLTDSAHLDERCRSLRNLCFQSHKRFVHEELGWNYRMTNMQAALGVAQLERLDEVVLHKCRMGQKYNELLTNTPGLQLPVGSSAEANNIYWVYGVVLKDNVPCTASDIMERLKEKGIGSRPFFWPMHWQPVFQKLKLFAEETYPVAERLANCGFYLPSGSAMSLNEIQTCADALHEIMTNAV